MTDTITSIHFTNEVKELIKGSSTIEWDGVSVYHHSNDGDHGYQAFLYISGRVHVNINFNSESKECYIDSVNLFHGTDVAMIKTVADDIDNILSALEFFLKEHK